MKIIRPVALVWREGDSEMVKCPKCGHTDDIQGFDVLGADGGCVFCVRCHCEMRAAIS